MSEEAVLRMRIVSVDFYSAPPNSTFDETYNHFRSSLIYQIPIIRLFGITSTGEKACIHMHGFFPYIYVPLPTSRPKGTSLLHEVADSLDEALSNSFGTKKQHVLRVSTASGKPFYGYHERAQDFLKIEFYHPSSVKRGLTLLQVGAICNEKLQPHEAHVPYILQFFIDYNLYGMSFLNLSDCTPRFASNTGSTPVQNSFLIKTTTCAVEVDAKVSSILNPHSSSGALNPGLANIREEEERRHLEDGVPLEESSPADSRDYSPSPSDLRFRDYLHTALQERRKNELSDETSSQLSVSQLQGAAPVTFDNEDMSVLKVLFGRLMGDDQPDEDSVLGFTPEQENPDEDLSQPFVSFIVHSDEEEETTRNENLSETMIWPELDGLSQINYDADSPPMYVDGNFDDEKTPEKRPRRSASDNSPRYVPLDVKLHKSPRNKNIGGKNQGRHSSSPELFKNLEKNVSSLRSIKSPNSKVTESPNLKLPSCSHFSSEAEDIIDDSDDELVSQNIFSYDFLGKTSTGKGRSKMGPSVRKELFRKTPSSSDILSDQLDSKLVAPLAYDETSSKSVEGSEVTSIPVSVGNESKHSCEEVEVNDEGTEGTCVSALVGNDSKPSSGERIVNEEGETVICKNSSDDEKKANYVLENNEETKELEEASQPVLSRINSQSSNAQESEECHHFSSQNLDTSCFSQSTIKSFYGDTTILGDMTVCQTLCEDDTIITPALSPPTEAEISSSLQTYGLNKVLTENPHYKDPKDASSSKEVGVSVVSLKSNYAHDLEEFKGSYEFSSWPASRWSRRKMVILEPAIEPPTSDSIRKEMELLSQTTVTAGGSTQHDSQSSLSIPLLHPVRPAKLMKKKTTKLDRKHRQSGEIEHATPNNSGMFKLSFQNLQDVQEKSLHKFTTLMVVEIHANTRGDLRPDPQYDGVEAFFYVIANDVPDSCDELLSRQTGVVMVSQDDNVNKYPFDCSIQVVTSEAELFSSLISLVEFHNPDIIAGYEIEMLSWGYLIERGYVLGLNLMSALSRVKTESTTNITPSDKFQNKDYDLKVPGRIVLNVWRLMRHEVSLYSYSFESMAYHILHTRIPKFSFKTLTFWWNHFSKLYRYLVLKYYLTMVDGIEKLLDQLNLIGRTGELASLFGIQFYEVFSRGSQFRVESMMLRLAKRLNFVAVSPNVEQRAHMRAPASLPLIMEPESRFYADPVIVLDFQSLYPSMIIAYNYCFSTCLGRVASLSEASEFKFGCTELRIPLEDLLKVQKNIHVSPAGVAFVDKSIRHGVLPQMLNEILQTRLMVKSSMKRHKSDKLLSRVLDARQLGLKLIANVTYGYTSANFSGRMPCIEVGDSVVSKGRETLERAIHLVENHPEWGARVVYGDTDSMFVLCPGRTREEAFVIGQQIADSVTASNPSPVKLKLEKVYQPCILQTKKRYVGYMYESPDQKKPVYDAKGIETVRRDGCPAASKILEKSLKLLFETNDMSVVKGYVIRQMVKILSGRLSPADLVFAKEYRGASGYHPNAPVPALKIARELERTDKRAVPRVSERVPYVVVCGPPGVPLITLIRSLPQFISKPEYSLNADYYISKAILPPLDRCLCLLGVDVFSWYSDLPKKQIFKLNQIGEAKRKATIAQYFKSVECLTCGSLAVQSLCEKCERNPSRTLILLSQMVSRLERKHYLLHKICESCCGRNYETDCISLDCPIYYRRLQSINDKTQTVSLCAVIDELSQF